MFSSSNFGRLPYLPQTTVKPEDVVTFLKAEVHLAIPHVVSGFVIRDFCNHRVILNLLISADCVTCAVLLNMVNKSLDDAIDNTRI